MSAAAEPSRSTEPSRLDQVVERLRAAAPVWAKLHIGEKLALARAMQRGMLRVAERSVLAACAAKGLTPGTPDEGEEWLIGPYTVVRNLRLLIEALEALARGGLPSIGPVSRTADGRLSVRAYPHSAIDSVLKPGLRADVHLQVGFGEAELDAGRAPFYRRPDHAGKVSLVLGAGNLNSIPPSDVIEKMFGEGKVCLLKMNPVNAYLGPFLEEAFREAIDRGFLAVVYGGAEEGGYLAGHPGVDEVHITGSDKTHDAIVWGPAGPERNDRMARDAPLLCKEITSELGNISPVIVVPGPYDDDDLAYQAESVAGGVTLNASFNCIANKMLVTPRGWKRRDHFLDAVGHVLAQVPARPPWYPGARERWEKLAGGRASLRTFGGGEGLLPWALVSGLDADAKDEPAFRMEPFCALLSEVQVGSDDPAEFLEAAVKFSNERLWGTLAATILVHPRTLADPTLGPAVERAVSKLRYGIVGVNVWAGGAFVLSVPWGAYPGSTLKDIQSGRGWVHNPAMIQGIEKLVVRAPLWRLPKLPYFPTHRTRHLVGRRLTALEEHGSWLKFPSAAIAGLMG